MNDFLKENVVAKIGLAGLAALLVLMAVNQAVVVFDRDGKKADGKDKQEYSISVNGTGKVVVKPDTARINLGVQTKATTAAEATKKNTATYNAVLASVKGMGIEEKDIKTISYNLYPSYRYIQNENRSVIDGYELSQMIQVKVRDLDSIGDVIGKAAAAGANQAGDIAFIVDDEDKTKAEARDAAIAQAKEKAENIAKAAGIKLGRIIGFSESGDYPVPQPMYFAKESSVAADGMGGGPSIQPGSQEMSVTVTVQYEIK